MMVVLTITNLVFHQLSVPEDVHKYKITFEIYYYQNPEGKSSNRIHGLVKRDRSTRGCRDSWLGQRSSL